MKIFVLLLSILITNVASAAIDNMMARSLKCSRLFSIYEKKYGIPKGVLEAISLKETGVKHPEHTAPVPNPWAVCVNSPKVLSQFFTAKELAMNFVYSQLLSGNNNIDVGCMQINLRSHPKAFRTLNDAFNPHKNIDFAASLLRKHYDRLGNWKQAIAHYHSASSLGKAYSDDVMRILGRLDEYKQMIISHYSKSYRSKGPTKYDSFSSKQRYSSVYKSDPKKSRRM